jgi:hypothetical protein
VATGACGHTKLLAEHGNAPARATDVSRAGAGVRAGSPQPVTTARTRRRRTETAAAAPALISTTMPPAPIPASPQSNDDDVDVEVALTGALGPEADELIATRAGDGAIAACVWGVTGTLTAPPSIGIAIATDGKPAVAATVKAASHRLI